MLNKNYDNEVDLYREQKYFDNSNFKKKYKIFVTQNKIRKTKIYMWYNGSIEKIYISESLSTNCV